MFAPWDLEVEVGYNARIKELLRERGLPPGAMARHFVSTDDLVERVKGAVMHRTTSEALCGGVGRWVVEVEERVLNIGTAEDRACVVNPDGADGISIDESDDPEQLFVGLWRKGLLVRALNVRSRLILQSVSPSPRRFF